MTSSQGSAIALGIKLAFLLGLQALAQHSYGALAPAIRDDISAGADEMGLIAGALYFGTLIAAFSFGPWVDRFPPRRIAVMASLAVGGAVLGIASSSTTMRIAIGFLFLGLGRGAIPPLTDRVGFELAPPQSRGLVFGIKQTGTPLAGVVAASLLAPIAAGSLGWRGAMTVLAGIVIAGYAIIAPALPATPVGDAVGGDQERPASRTSNLVRNLSIPIAASFGLGIHQATVVTFLTLYLVDSSGVSPVQAATSFAVLSLGGAVGRVVWGWISDRVFGGRRALVLATSAILAALMAFAVGQLPSALTGASGHILIGAYGFVSQGWVGISRAWGVELAGPGLSGRAGGLLLGSMMTGGLIGPIIFGNVVEWRGGYADAWSLLGLSTLIVGLLALRSGLQAESQHGTSHAVGD